MVEAKCTREKLGERVSSATRKERSGILRGRCDLASLRPDRLRGTSSGFVSHRLYRKLNCGTFQPLCNNNPTCDPFVCHSTVHESLRMCFS